MLPITLKLKRKSHKEIAYAQDLIVETLYSFFQKAVIHGGTAIWRCYSGNSFSEDVDVYIAKDKNKINEMFSSLENRGFSVIKKRIKENSLYSTLRFNRSIVRLEALFKSMKYPFLKEYEASDGISINVFTLTPEGLIKEKISAYLKRRKIRDLYDIFFLLRHVKDKKSINKDLKDFIKNFINPIYEQDLKALIISGPTPTSKNMLEYIERWAK